MKKLIIDRAHEAEINAALVEAQGKATARIISDYDELEEYVEDYKKELPDVPKLAFEGCELIISVGAGAFPSAYKYRPMGTYCIIRFRKDGKGEVVKIGRADCEGGKSWRWRVTEKMRAYIMTAMRCEVIEEE
ncbi:hypothetical protein [Selenomonas sp. AB3002]|uniref:hypothetical protein n=1 Tax=Selenomonas sp. AB3002 TaxID=1392502 RepID=UPI000497841B